MDEDDRARLANRQDGLRTLAEQTDGAWILSTNDTAGAITRILADTSSYYLLSYYSSNPKLDGRFRRITVKVKRENTEVRHRMGYLAPTESEARAAGASAAGAINRITGTLGIKTTLPLFQDLLQNEDILKGDYDIHWLEKYLAGDASH